MMNKEAWTKQRISWIIGTIIGLFTIIGGVFGAQEYMNNKYAEEEDIEHVMMLMSTETEDIEQLVAMNARSIELNQYRLEQKIVQDKIDRKLDWKDRIELRKPTTPAEHVTKQQSIRRYDRDIRELERELESIDKP